MRICDECGAPVPRDVPPVRGVDLEADLCPDHMQKWNDGMRPIRETFLAATLQKERELLPELVRRREVERESPETD